MKLVINPITAKLDWVSEATDSDFVDAFVNVIGDTMTGPLVIDLSASPGLGLQLIGGNFSIRGPSGGSAENRFNITNADSDSGDAAMFLYDRSGVAKLQILSGAGNSFFTGGGNFGIGTISPDSAFHIKAGTSGTVGSHSAGQLIIQSPTDSVFSNAVITGYESDGDGNPDQQLWYLGSSSVSNSDIIYLNRRNSALALGTNNTARLTILSGGNVGINTTSPDTKLQVVGDTKLGDDNTNYMEVGTTGDVVFVGSSGLAFGEISTFENAVATILNSAAKVQITVFDTDGLSNNTIPDHTNDHITITKAGKYLVTISIHVNNNAAQTHVIDVSLYKNDGDTALDNVHGHRTLTGGSGDVGSMSLSGIIDAAVDDTLELWADTGDAADRSVTFQDITLSIVQIGG